jgi:hypothetical protein
MVLGAYFFYGFKVERELNTFVALIVTMIAIIALGAIVNQQHTHRSARNTTDIS